MTETETLFNGRWLRLRRRGRWEFAERTNPGGGVLIVAVTAQDKLLLVEQWREALRCKTIELPAGLVGDEASHPAETAIEAAARELTEETGYRAERVEMLMAGPSSAGMSSEILTLVRAHDLTRVHAGGGDEHEAIVVHEIALTDVPRWLATKMREGFAVDPRLYAALYFIEHPPAT